jgi:hypothetical protein
MVDLMLIYFSFVKFYFQHRKIYMCNDKSIDVFLMLDKISKLNENEHC